MARTLSRPMRMVAAAVGATAVAAALLWAFARPPAATSAAGASRRPIHVTILHVNDSHGRLGGLSVDGRRVGGVARLATAVERVRRQSTAQRVFLVHCGDEFSRGDALTQRTAGAANVAIMNRLRYDLLVPGNGEFYNGVATLRRRIAEASFPVLAANVELADGCPLAERYIIEQAGPVRLAFFGLCTVHKSDDVEKSLRALDAMATARALVPQLRSRADAVVAVTHLGLRQDQRLAGAVGGIDVILGGHSHNALHHGFRGEGPAGQEVLICQAGDQYRYCGRVDLEFTPRAGGGYVLSVATAGLIPLDETVEANGEVAAMLDRLAIPTAYPASVPSTEPAETADEAELVAVE